MKLWFKKLTPTMQIVVVLAVVLVVFLTIRAVKSYASRIGQYSEQLGEQAALVAQGQQKSYSQSQYNTMANQLYYALKGAGTDEETVYSVMGKMQNDLDIIALDNAFGMRDASSLQAWLRGDLSSSEMQQVNMILSNKGITKSF